MGWLRRCPGIVWKPIREQAHMQLIREHSATVIPAHRASVDWSWHKEWNWCAQANLHSPPKKKQKKKHRWGINDQTFFQNPNKRGKSHHHSCQDLNSQPFNHEFSTLPISYPGSQHVGFIQTGDACRTFQFFLLHHFLANNLRFKTDKQ